MGKKIGTLIKSFKGRRKSSSGAEYDTILLIYRDENGVKKTLFYDRPEVSYYIIKDKESPEAIKPPMYIENYKVQEVKVYSDLLLRDIASKTNALGFYEAVATTKGIYSYDMHNIFKHPWIYGADMDLSDRYIAKFQNEYDPDPNYKLHKCYFDIEVDLMPNGFRDNGFSGFPDEDVAPCPVNVITLIDGKFKKIYTFVRPDAVLRGHPFQRGQARQLPIGRHRRLRAGQSQTGVRPRRDPEEPSVEELPQIRDLQHPGRPAAPSHRGENARRRSAAEAFGDHQHPQGEGERRT
jgi:hypothetical protein